YALVRRLASQRAAIFVVLVFAISPFHIWYSQEARMYTQLLFFSLLSILVLLKSLESTNSSWWALYTVVVTIGMYTHIFMAFSVVAQFLWALLYYRPRILSYMISIAAAGTLFIFPLAKFLLQGYSALSQPAGGAGFSWGALPYTVFVYATGFSLGPHIAALHENRNVAFVVQFMPTILAVTITFGALLFVGVLSSYKYLEPKYVHLFLL